MYMMHDFPRCYPWRVYLWKISVLKFLQTIIDDFISFPVKCSLNFNFISIVKMFWILLGSQFFNNWKGTVESIKFMEAQLL